MGLYGAYFAVWGVDPMGLEGGNHWFPQSPRLQTLLGKKCPLILEPFSDIQKFIDLLTTPMAPVRVGNLHHAIHYKLKDGFYLKQVEDIYNNSKDCCDLLKKMKDLILRVWAEANSIVRGGVQGPWQPPPLMPYDKAPWNTWQYLDDVIDVICTPKKPPGHRPPCPVPVPVPVPKPDSIPNPIFPEPRRFPWMEPGMGIKRPQFEFFPTLEFPEIPDIELTREQVFAGCVLVAFGARQALRVWCPPTNLIPPLPYVF
jgi:hypothetical protein